MTFSVTCLFYQFDALQQVFDLLICHQIAGKHRIGLIGKSLGECTRLRGLIAVIFCALGRITYLIFFGRLDRQGGPIIQICPCESIACQAAISSEVVRIEQRTRGRGSMWEKRPGTSR